MKHLVFGALIILLVPGAAAESADSGSPPLPIPGKLAQNADPGTILLEAAEEGSYLSFSREDLEEWLCPGPQRTQETEHQGTGLSEGALTTEIGQSGRVCQTAQDFILAGQTPSAFSGKHAPLEVLPFGTSDGALRLIKLHRLCLEGYEILDVCGRWIVDARLDQGAAGTMALLSPDSRQSSGTAVLTLNASMELTFTNSGNGSQVIRSWPLDLLGTAPWTTEPGPDAFYSAIPFQTPSPTCVPEDQPLTVPASSNIFLGWRALKDTAVPLSFCLLDSQTHGRLCFDPALLN